MRHRSGSFRTAKHEKPRFLSGAGWCEAILSVSRSGRVHPRRLRKQAEEYEKNEEYGAFQADRRASGHDRVSGASLRHVARHHSHGRLPVLTPRNHMGRSRTTPVAKILRKRPTTTAMEVFLTLRPQVSPPTVTVPNRLLGPQAPRGVETGPRQFH